MFEYQDTIVIDRPVPEVFAFLIVAKNFPKWVDTTVDAWQDSDGQVVVGTRQTEMILSPFSRTSEPLALSWEISELEENRLISFETNSDWGYQKQSFIFTPLEKGTKLQVVGIHRFQGSKRLMQPVLGFFIKRDRRKHLRNLKQILESDRPED